MRHHARQFEFSEMRKATNMRTDEKRQPTYTDTDVMEFGKHRGELLSDVPARYLRWLWEAEGGPMLRTYSNMTVNPNAQVSMVLYGKIKLANYIWNSKDAIAQELGEELT